MKTIKKLLIPIAVLGIAVGVVGYKMWNKPHVDILNAAVKKVNASELYSAFEKDSSTATKSFVVKNLVIEVTGEIASITKNQQNKPVIVLKTTGNGGINCEFEGKADNLKTGTNISIKGICTGIGQSDADLGLAGDVYLTRCYLSLK